MPKIQYLGWNYAKNIIREYGKSGLRDKERAAVEKTIEETKALSDGMERLRLINLVFWKQSRTLDGACMACCISERTGRRWHTDFIRRVCKNLDLV